MMTPIARFSEGLHFHSYQHYRTGTLTVESVVLKGNPLQDPATRAHPMLLPRTSPPQGGYPVVFVLSGFTGNGPNAFNLKTFETNLPATLDACRARGEAPDAVFIFVDAMTAWGGSQFVNSEGTGRYEDYVAHEIPTVLRQNVADLATDPARWCVMGGSSGGYGALHLASAHPHTFSTCAAIAPDSFFEASLLPEVWTALPVLHKVGGIRGVRDEIKQGRFMKRREAHSVLNAIAMGLCYAPKGDGVEWPVSEVTGQLRTEIWQKWKAHDPIEFLRAREDQVEQLKYFFLDCGNRDQYHLHYGARQIRSVLEDLGVDLAYSEFDGNHFDIGERRPLVWKWLSRIWRM
ncbi:MAG: esterase family protein [Bdellovibrionaceae bacterium]|nr:esterase family protein [Pseudobdellovibrionaceae bacterium]